MARKIKKTAVGDKPITSDVYKEETAPDLDMSTDNHLAHHPRQNFQSGSQSHPVHQSVTPQTPQQPHFQGYPSANGVNLQSAYSSPRLGNGLTLQHQSPYGPAHQDPSYYASHPSPHSTHSVSGRFPASVALRAYDDEIAHRDEEADAADPMAATAHMQRPYPPIYHTPQSNSPASVASPQAHHDQHGRPIYNHQAPQLAQPIYGYQYPPMNQVQHSPYGPHPSQQQQHPHQMTSQPMFPHQQGTAPISHPQNQGQHSSIASSPQMKMEPGQQHQAVQQQRAPIVQQQAAPSGPAVSTPNLQQNQGSTAGVNSNAAPGPIPATTPLVVRQDGNGVQWIAFEYSRDRVKMEYTIRCDVESVTVDTLSQEFKTENCVYPRACCGKDQYKGNRLAYETECNAVGWALAELNPCLRSKRGLIQRAVDSWRNSNQDPRLRSRRVRRQAKMNNRSKISTQQANQMAAPGVPGSAGMPGSATSMTPTSARAPSHMSMGNAQLHHHHAHPDGSAPGQGDVSAEVKYPNFPPPQHRAPSVHQMATPTDTRQSQVFGGYPNYPVAPSSGGPSMPPLVHDGMTALGRPASHANATSKSKDEKIEEDSTLFGDVSEIKPRKFILVDDTQRNSRVRVKVTLDQVEMSEIPDSFREKNSVHPRSYAPVQMQLPSVTSRGDRFVEEAETEDDDGLPTIGRTLVPVQMLDNESEVAVPKLTRSKRRKEQHLNELGYRMAWSQMRVFDGRTIFLQRALDAYRNKQRSSMISAGQEASAIPPHLETRVGKRRWIERTSAPVIHTATPPRTVSSQ